MEEKPTVDELCEHICIDSKWYHLTLNDVKLDDIYGLAEDSTYKTLKMFKLWLGTNTHAKRTHVLDALRKEFIEENTSAYKYEKIFKMFCSWVSTISTIVCYLCYRNWCPT